MSESRLQTPVVTITERAQLKLIRDVSGMYLTEQPAEIPPEPSHRTPLEVVNLVASSALDLYGDDHQFEEPFTQEQAEVIEELVIVALLGENRRLHEVARQLHAELPVSAAA